MAAVSARPRGAAHQQSRRTHVAASGDYPQDRRLQQNLAGGLGAQHPGQPHGHLQTTRPEIPRTGPRLLECRPTPSHPAGATTQPGNSRCCQLSHEGPSFPRHDSTIPTSQRDDGPSFSTDTFLAFSSPRPLCALIGVSYCGGKQEPFYGTSPNAVRTQVWISISVYVLVAILKKELKLDRSLREILQILSTTLFEKSQLS